MEKGKQLWQAVSKKEHDKVRQLLLDPECQINYQDPDMLRSPFFRSCGFAGDLELVTMLLDDPRTDVNLPNKKGYAPLQIACFSGRKQIVKTLVASPKTDLKGLKWSENHVMVVSLDDDEELLRYFDRSESDPNEADSVGFTPVYLVSALGRVNVILAWLKNPRMRFDGYLKTGIGPFYTACYNGHTQIVKAYLEDPRFLVNRTDDEDYCPFSVACFNGHVDVIKLLLDDKRVIVNRTFQLGSSPFYMACQEGHAEIVRILLGDYRIDANLAKANGCTSFYVACQNGHLNVIKILLHQRPANGCPINYNASEHSGYTPFSVACFGGKLEVVKYLLEDDRIDINLPTKDRITPIWSAVQNRHEEVIKWLLSSRRQVDVHLTSAPGNGLWNNKTPANWARFLGLTETAQLIDEYSVDPVKCALRLRKELHILDFDAAKVFSLIVLYSDGYLQTCVEEGTVMGFQQRKSLKFLSFARKLPMDLQMLLCNRLFNLNKPYVPVNLTTKGMKWIAEMYLFVELNS